MLYLVGKNGMEWIKLMKNNISCGDNWEKKCDCRFVMIEMGKKMSRVRNGAFLLKMGCLNISLGC